ncbi:MAG: hypothetical protein CMG78_12035 [Marinobacter sp.]|nr:hypothetical protein [Marinobacter sp.]
MAKYTSHVTETPQMEKAHPDQVENSAGGFAFKVDRKTQLERFLILGNDKGTYYASEAKLTIKNFENLTKLLNRDGKVIVDLIVDISVQGRAPKNSSAVFAMAVASTCDDRETRAYANERMPEVCRTATDFFTWVDAVHQLRRGRWGKGITRAMARWYTGKTARDLAYQVCKYPNRKTESMAKKWGHRDILRLIRLSETSDDRGYAFKTPSTDHNTAIKYAVQGRDLQNVAWITPDQKVKDTHWTGFDDTDYAALKGNENLQYIWAHEEAKASDNAKEVAQLIKDYHLTRESIPNEYFSNTKIWDAMLPSMLMTAMIRSLGQMTSCDFLKPLSPATKLACEKLTDEELLQKGRIHPVGILIAMLAYKTGHGKAVDRKTGKHRVTWTPVQAIMDALNEAFYASFKYVEPTGKNFLLGVDVSGSMYGNKVVGCDNLNAGMAAAVMALSIAKVEKNNHIMGFSHKLVPLDITPSMRLDSVVRTMRHIEMGGTDCALPMLYATKEKLDVDAFVVFTDNETWYGDVHPYQALDDYRAKTGIDARLVIMAFTATEFTLINRSWDNSSGGYWHQRGTGDAPNLPKGDNNLDACGLDSAAPKLISDFLAHKI